MKSTGLLVLDAHRTPFDIFRTATWLRKKHPSKIIHLPVAGYFPYAPIFKNIFNFYSTKRNLTIHPVYRKTEKIAKDPLTRFYRSFYPKSLTDEKKEKLNQKYLEVAKDAMQSENEIVLLSPYGGCSYYGQKVKDGVKLLIKENPQMIVTHTKIKTKFNQFKINDFSDQNISKELKKAFENL